MNSDWKRRSGYSPGAHYSTFSTTSKEGLTLLRMRQADSHDPQCDSEQRFIHDERCPFWTKGVCLTEKDVHGVVIDPTATCHPAPCNCRESSALNPLSAKPEEDIPDYEAAVDELCGSGPGVAGEEAEIAQPEKIECPSARLMLLCFLGACIFGPLGYLATGPIPASPLDAYRYTMAWSPFCVCISILLLGTIFTLRNTLRNRRMNLSNKSGPQ